MGEAHMTTKIEIDVSERWRSIPSVDGYEVSDMGNVRRMRTVDTKGRLLKAKALKPQKQRTGYLRVCFKRRFEFVHRLVLFAFAGPCPDGCQARHLNGVRDDNRFANLKWGTVFENSADRSAHGTTCKGQESPNAKLTDAEVRSIRRLRASGLSLKDLSDRFGISKSLVSQIARGAAWRHVAFNELFGGAS